MDQTMLTDKLGRQRQFLRLRIASQDGPKRLDHLPGLIITSNRSDTLSQLVSLCKYKRIIHQRQRL